MPTGWLFLVDDFNGSLRDDVILPIAAISDILMGAEFENLVVCDFCLLARGLPCRFAVAGVASFLALDSTLLLSDRCVGFCGAAVSVFLLFLAAWLCALPFSSLLLLFRCCTSDVLVSSVDDVTAADLTVTGLMSFGVSGSLRRDRAAEVGAFFASE